jgi:hypothetical protein
VTHLSQSHAAGTVEDLATLYVMRGGEEIPEIPRSSLSWRVEISSTSPMSTMLHHVISTRPLPNAMKYSSDRVDDSFSSEGNFLYQLLVLSSLPI